MENLQRGLNIEQAYDSASKIREERRLEAERREKEAAVRFGCLALGCLIYAVLYAVCMYKNKESITFPVFVGITLYFFYFFAKKYDVSVAKKNRFLLISITILGILSCTTASGVMIGLNKLLILFLLCVLVLKTYFDVSEWNIAHYLCSVLYVAGGSLVQMFTPFSDIPAFIRFRTKNNKKIEFSDKAKQRAFAVVAGFVVAIPMVFIVLSLLCEADAYFSEVCEKMFFFIFDMDFDLMESLEEVVKICVTIVLVFALSYGVLTYVNGKNGIEELVHQKRTQWDSFAAITFCSMIGMIYVVFVWIQIAGLFMGKLTLPDGYTYAEYAREGFFQLVFVCLFNVCLVLVSVHCFQKHKVLQILLVIISLCTYVMLLSSAYRMFMYIREYQLTFLRVFVLWGILVIAIVMAGVIIAIFKEQFPLFSYLLIVVTTLYIGFATLHPDYLIARYNVTQKEMGNEIDEWYLRKHLSLDAAGVVFEMYEKDLYEEIKTEVYIDEDNRIYKHAKFYYERITEETEGMNLRSYNISKGIAKMYADDFWGNYANEYGWDY